ncbi:MAG: hypothetical protein JJ975_11450 [Bacteroidia bacterium]|nr:hypothetical protein [Bacteroidia bacterium]
MRLIKLLSLAIGWCLANQAHAQHSNLTLNEDFYHIVDRYSILNSGMMDYCTSIKPIRRENLRPLFIAPDIERTDHDSRDQFNQTVVHSDNWDIFSHSEAYRFRSKKPLLKYFYRSKGSFFTVNEKEFKLTVNPVLGLGIGQSNSERIYRNTRGAELRGTIGNNVGFYSFLSENQFAFPDYYNEQIVNTRVIPGTGLIKQFGNNGYDFFNVRGYITLQANKYIHVQFGHDHNFIGNGYRSLIISDFAKENLALKFRTKVWRINYLNLFSELTDFQNTGITGLRKKYSALHYLNIAIIPGKLDVGLFENIVFARNDSNQQAGYEFNYLNPIIFYRAVEHGLNSSDNSLLGADWKWNIAPSLSLYGQFILDEFHKNELFNRTGSWVNKWGFQSGIKYLNVAGINNLDLQLETNIVRPYVYTHFKTDQTWTHFNQPMAHPMGANFKEYLAIIRYQISPRLNIIAKYFNITHGADSTLSDNTTHFGGNVLTNYYNRPKDTGISIGDGLTQKIQIADIKLSYQIYQRTFIDLRYIWRDANRASPLTPFTNSMFLVGARMNIASNRLDF